MPRSRPRRAGRPWPRPTPAEQWRLRAALQLGWRAVADEATARIARLAERGGLPLARWHLLRGQAARAALEGHFAAARAHSKAAGALATAFGDQLAIGLGHALGVNIALLRGDATELSAGFWPNLDAMAPSPLMTVFRASALLVEGRTEDSRAAYEQLRPLLGDPPDDDTGWSGVLVQLIDLVEAFGDAAAARLLADQLRPYTAYPGAFGLPTALFVGAMAGPFGRALAHAGELVEAETALRGAITADLALGARPYVVLSQLALADVLLRRGAADAAVPIAGEAAAQARRLDMPGPLARAGQLLTDLAAARRAVDPLTAREHEVAALLAKGQSNRQIAAALVLSERTVESHVRNILAKLGCANRVELLASGRLPAAPP